MDEAQHFRSEWPTISSRTAAWCLRPGNDPASGPGRHRARWRPGSLAALAARFAAAYGTVHFWLDAPLQVHIWSCVPLVVLPLGSSRHLPEVGLTSAPFWDFHCWLPPPLQLHSSTSVPLL